MADAVTLPPVGWDVYHAEVYDELLRGRGVLVFTVLCAREDCDRPHLTFASFSLQGNEQIAAAALDADDERRRAAVAIQLQMGARAVAAQLGQVPLVP